METAIKKKKVLIFVPSFPVLTETFIQREIVYLAQNNNIEVNILSLEKGNGLPDTRLNEKLHYYRLNILRIIPTAFFILFNIKKIYIAFRNLDPKVMGFLKRIFLVIKSAGYTRKFRKFSPDFLFVHFMSEPSTIAMIAADILGIQFGISAHARDVIVNSQFMKEKVVKAKFILVCNKNALFHIEKTLNMKSIPNVYVHYHGIDFTEIDSLVSGMENPPTVPLVFNIGRLTEKKGHEYLIDASSVLKNRDINHLIYIVGPGPKYKELNDLVISKQLENFVKILGEGNGLPFEEISKIFRSSKVYVSSGVTSTDGDEDGVPNVLVEAAAFRVPIVTTDAGSTSDLVTNEVTGLLVRQKDYYALADAIERMLFDDTLRSRVIDTAYKLVKEKFDVAVNAEEIVKLINL